MLFCWYACLNYLMLYAVIKYFVAGCDYFLFACCSGFCFLFVVLLLEKIVERIIL